MYTTMMRYDGLFSNFFSTIRFCNWFGQLARASKLIKSKIQVFGKNPLFQAHFRLLQYIYYQDSSKQILKNFMKHSDESIRQASKIRVLLETHICEHSWVLGNFHNEMRHIIRKSTRFL